MSKLHLGEFVIVLLIVLLTTFSMYSTYDVVDDEPKEPLFVQTSLETAHVEKHKMNEKVKSEHLSISCEHALEPYETSKGCSTSAKHCLHETDIPCCQTLGFRTLEKIVHVLETNNIKYSLDKGTLAAARDQIMQPWDTRDMDIAIPKSKMQLLLKKWISTHSELEMSRVFEILLTSLEPMA